MTPEAVRALLVKQHAGQVMSTRWGGGVRGVLQRAHSLPSLFACQLEAARARHAVRAHTVIDTEDALIAFAKLLTQQDVVRGRRRPKQ